MAVICIEGTPASGKSFLTKQLASMHEMPAFFEGEEGTIPQHILDDIFSGTPHRRFTWFMERYRNRLARAHQISALGLDVYVDSGLLTYQSYIPYEDPQYHADLQELYTHLLPVAPDVSVVLSASPETIAEGMRRRQRSFEDSPTMIQRSIDLQENLLHILNTTDLPALLIERSTLDFSDSGTLEAISKDIQQRLKD